MPKGNGFNQLASVSRLTIPEFSRKFCTSALVISLKARLFSPMHQVKDTLRASVRMGYDGRVHKTFRGPKAEERFANEVRILKHLEAAGCPFVPRLLENHPDELRIVTTSCGSRVEHLDEERTKELFAELEEYGVRHDDPEMRNVTYRQQDGRFCLIDFEFATLLTPSDKSANG